VYQVRATRLFGDLPPIAMGVITIRNKFGIASWWRETTSGVERWHVWAFCDGDS